MNAAQVPSGEKLLKLFCLFFRILDGQNKGTDQALIQHAVTARFLSHELKCLKEINAVMSI